MAGETILIVDDEEEIVELLTLYLNKEGFTTISTGDGTKVMDLMQQHTPSLVILDILLPGMDGIEICRMLRQSYTTPILFVSCKNEDMDIILGFDTGGDDYITKPFSPSQVVARVKAHLRRIHIIGQSKEDTQMITYPGLEIDLLSRTVKVEGQPAGLSSKEFDLLVHLAKSPNKVIPLEQLYQLTWGFGSGGDTRTLLVHISNLRKKLEPNPSEPKYVLTVRGIGYKFSGE